jgi:hypothetical protein
MVSEYALGKHKWLLTSFFLFWGVSSMILSIQLWNVVTSNWARVGVVLLFISGIGGIMGGLFDLKHKYHGMAFFLGVPSLPIAALLVSYNLINIEKWDSHSSAILFTAHSTWISLIIMAVSMGVMISGFKKAGIAIGKNSEPPASVPEGVIALNGYANRLLVVCYILWLIIIANVYLSLQ